jgi:ATP-binding cassette, subfamily B, bacterial
MRDSWRALRLLLAVGFQADRRQWLVLFAADAAGQTAGVAATYGLKLLTNAVVRHGLSAALLSAAFIASMRLARVLGGRTYVALSIQIEEKTGHLLDRRLVALTAGIPTIAHHERADYARELDLLREQRRLLAQVTNAILLNARVYLTLILSAVLLARIAPVLVLLPLVGLGSFWTGRKADQIREAARETNAERWRLRAQLKELATSAAAGKELRLFGLGEEVVRRHHAIALEAGRETDRAAWKGTALAVLGSLLFAAGYIGAIALVLVRAVAGHATAGDVVLAISLAAQLDGDVAAIVAMGNYLGRTSRAAKRYLWLLDYARRAAGPR